MKLHFLDMLVLKILYDHEKSGGKRRGLFGAPPDYDGLVNQYMRDAGINKNEWFRYMRPLRSASTLNCAKNRLVKFGLLEDCSGYRITQFGIDFVANNLPERIKEYPKRYKKD